MVISCSVSQLKVLQGSCKFCRCLSRQDTCVSIHNLGRTTLPCNWRSMDALSCNRRPVPHQIMKVNIVPGPNICICTTAILLLLSAACDMEMGMGDGSLQDSQISASSVLNGDTANYGPQLARLNGLAAWRPNHNSRSEWIMV